MIFRLEILNTTKSKCHDGFVNLKLFVSLYRFPLRVLKEELSRLTYYRTVKRRLSIVGTLKEIEEKCRWRETHNAQHIILSIQKSSFECMIKTSKKSSDYRRYSFTL